MEHLRLGLLAIAEATRPTTARFVFYRGATQGLIPKTARGYKTVVRVVAEMRESGDMPFPWIADHTRWMRKPDTYNGLGDFLAQSARLYRRDLWHLSEVAIEIWAESDSVASVIGPVCEEYDVPLMVVRGYSSKAFAWDAAQSIDYHGRPTFLYWFGDWDASGVDIERALQASLRRYAPDADITVERVAVTPEQIARFSLPSSIVKGEDTRAKKFSGLPVEVEALEPDYLRTLCRSAIERHVNREHLDRLLLSEAAEREALRLWRSTA
jgi:hypothetical protein